MKKIYMLSALLCASLFSFTGCLKENFETPTPAKDGDEILFGARAGFESPATKTVYTGETYTNGGKTFERIEWLDEQDAIQVYCPEASGPNPSHYTVYHAEPAPDADTNKDYAYLVKNGDSALQWSGDGEHHFYAMYPSSSIFSVDQSTLASGIKMDGTVLRGTVPGAQAPISIEQEGNNWVAKPNMKFAYMAARSTATRAKGNVSLTFVPIVTAVQIQLTLAEGALDPVSIAEIQVQGNGIAGDFSADLSETAWTDTYYPPCKNEGDGTGVIQVSMWKDSKPITLEDGQSLTFTVFLRPGVDYKNLKVSYSPTGAGYLGKTLGSELKPVTIKKNLKTVITGFNLPARFEEKEEQITIDASKWMSQLAGDTPMKKLSIPGTGGSFSYNYTSSNPGWYQQQTITLDEQWKAGIRAFEIVSDRPDDVSTSLGTEDVKCNKVSMGVTVLEVLQNLLAKTAATPTGETGPTECAVLILTYQPEGNSPARNGASYATSLKAMYDGLTTSQQAQIIQYTPDLTLADAKGKVMIFCRINQKDEKDNGDTSDKGAFQIATETLAGTNITLIDGCGTGKDRWGSRGYKVNGNVAYDAANTGDSNKSVDYYLKQAGNVLSGFSWPNWDLVKKPVAENGDLNFAFKTNYTDVTCWYQEWARVVPASLIGSNGWYQINGTSVFGSQISEHTRWYESYNEKVAAAEKTFEMAISGQYGTYVFINSLCGYFVDSSISSSYTIFTGSNTGGIAGNIKALADKLNPAFYQYVLGAGLEQTTGPTGIVMMDYVTNTPNTNVEFDGSYLLPGVIISNNFKHGSGNGANTPEGGQGGQGGQGGDSETPGGGNEEGGI